MPKITPVKAYETDNIRTSRKKPLVLVEGTTKNATTKSANADKVVIHPQNPDALRKALKLRLERLEGSNLTSEQKTIMREKIQTRLNSLE